MGIKMKRFVCGWTGDRCQRCKGVHRYNKTVKPCIMREIKELEVIKNEKI